MQHTSCALEGQSDEQPRSTLPPEQAKTSMDWPLRGMPEPNAALAHDVGLIASCRAIPTDLAIAGWRYDVATGRVTDLVSMSTTGC